jgi:hypothetical protein
VEKNFFYLERGPFDIASSVTLEELEQRKREGSMESVLLDPDTVFMQFGSYKLNEIEERKFMNGVEIEIEGQRLEKGIGTVSHPDETRSLSPSPTVALPDTGYDKNGYIVRVYSAAGDFAAIGTIHGTEGEWRLKVKKFFI